MGYTTEFYGRIEIVPPLSEAEITYLRKFATTRRMDRERGPYFVDGIGMCGQDRESDIRDYNQPPKGQPGLWCQWVPTDDGTALEWDGGEKFYRAQEWMTYLIDHFLRPGAVGKTADGSVTFANHTCNGEIEAQGEARHDHWLLVVKDNAVSTSVGQVVYRR